MSDVTAGRRPLIDAAMRVIAEHGLDGVTIDRLAEASGISRATLYRRDLDIDELIATALEEAITSYRDALWPALTGSGDARARLEAAMRALCTAADAHLLLLVRLFPHTHSPFHSDTPDKSALVREPFSEPFERLLRDGQTDGSLRTTDPVEDATVLFNLVSWTYVHLRHAHSWPPDQAADRIVAIVLNGFAPRDEEERR